MSAADATKERLDLFEAEGVAQFHMELIASYGREGNWDAVAEEANVLIGYVTEIRDKALRLRAMEGAG